MYEEIKEERRTGYTTKNIILITLSVLFFVFLLMWIFPTKNEIRKGLKPFYNQLFTQNMNTMKEAAKSYYTLQRLPQNVGDKAKMTLDEMLELKIILPLMDSNGKQCDIEKSYVEVRKDKDEYVMKINLHCTDKQDYILVHMGCYDYCSTTICEKKETTTNNPSNPQTEKKYKCEYLKVTNGGYTPWSSWSEWTTNVHYENDLKKVENKTETSYKEENRLIGYDVTKKDDPSKPVYGKVQVQIDEKIEKVCTATSVVKVPTGQYVYNWSHVAIVESSTVLYSTSTIRYTEVPASTKADYCVNNCTGVVTTKYKKEALTKTPVYKEEVQCTKWEQKITPIYTWVNKIIGYEQMEVKTPRYAIVKVPVVINYYRYATRTLTSGSENRKWSNCYDNNLLNNGYKIIQKVEVK